MDYTTMLNMLIDESGKMQKDITAECNEKYGVSITSSYLSILRNSSDRMASPEISRAIAKACNAPYEEILEVQGCLDRMPPSLLKFVQGAINLMNMGLSLAEGYGTGNFEVETQLQKITEIPMAEFICKYADSLENDAEQMMGELMGMPKQSDEPKCMVIMPEQLKNVVFVNQSEIEKLKGQ